MVGKNLKVYTPNVNSGKFNIVKIWDAFVPNFASVCSAFSTMNIQHLYYEVKMN